MPPAYSHSHAKYVEVLDWMCTVFGSPIYKVKLVHKMAPCFSFGGLLHFYLIWPTHACSCQNSAHADGDGWMNESLSWLCRACFFFPAGRLTKCSRNVRLSYGIQGFNFLALESLPNTELFVWSVAMFCYVFQGELQGPAWAVGSYSYSQSAGGIYHLQNLATDRTNSSVHFQRLKETLHIENCDVWQEWQIKVLPKQVTASFEFD